MMRMQGMKKTAFILIVSAAILLYNIGSYNLIAEQGVDILTPMYNEGQPGETEITPNNGEIEPPLNTTASLPRFNTIFTMMAFNFPIELAIVFFAEMVFSSIVRSDRKKMNFLRLLILLGSASALTVVNSLNHYFLIWPAMHDWPIHAGHTYNDTSIIPSGELKPIYGVQEEPINKNYSLTPQSWTFIQEVNLTANLITRYQWVSDLSVQGREVTKEQFNTMQGQNLSERSAYFETIGYYDGIQDSGKTTTEINGSIYFVFFNPNSLQANLDLTYTYQYVFFSPAVTILIFIAAAIIILGIHFAAFKFIQKLSITCSGVSLLMPALYYPIIWSALAQQTRNSDLLEKTGNQFMFALIISGIFLLTIILVLIWNLTLVGTQAVAKTQDTGSQEKYQQ
ncbi:MAG: hypothetical protein E3J70_07500 [Candidatus Heimdallarchaeota archaeon]|nr:MAG: hypothetical protein E3J70_07500 [Candidatus Heimdallarchaeota archaeon]